MISDPYTDVVTQYPIREAFQKFYPDHARLHPVNEPELPVELSLYCKESL